MSEWKEQAAKVYIMVLLLTAVTIGLFVFSYVAVDSHMRTPKWLSWVIYAGIVALQVIYMLRVRAFANIQSNDEDVSALTLVANGLTVLIVATVLVPVTGFLSEVEKNFAWLGLVVWLLMIVGSFMMKNGYRDLRDNENLSVQAQRGAENLRYAAVCNIRLLFAPLVLVIGNTLVMLLTYSSVTSQLRGATRIDKFDLESLTKPFEAVDGALSSLKGGFMIVAIFTIITFLLMLFWAIFAQVKSIMGWYRIKEGDPEEENEAEVEPQAPVASRYCKYCGTPLSAEALFCTHCGAKVGAAVAVSEKAPAAEESSAVQDTHAEEPPTEETHAEESPTEEAPSVEEAPAAEKTPVVEEAPDTVESLATRKLPAIVDDYEEEERPSWLKRNKRWLIVTGIIALLAALGAGAYFLFFNGENNPLGIEKPKWEKFVVVLESDVPVYKEADDNSPKLMELMENSDNMEAFAEYHWEDEGERRGYTRSEYHPFKNTVMPVLDESSDWYKVQIDTWGNGLIEAYISKDCCEEITPTPITQEILDEIDEGPESRCHYVVEKGKYKNLCFCSEIHEEEGFYGEIFQMGELLDGVLYFPYYDFIQAENTNSSKIRFKKFSNDDYRRYGIVYGHKHVYNPNQWGSGVLDTHQLSDELVEEIFNAVKTDDPQLITASYYFPEINDKNLMSFRYSPRGSKDNDNITPASNDDENIRVRGYSTRMNDDYEYWLVAELDNGTYEETGLQVGTGIAPDIVDVGDYDGDGNMEAIIQEHTGGTAGDAPPYIACYDQEEKKYCATEPFGKWDNVIVEQNEGRLMFFQRYGIHEDRYMFANGKLLQISLEKKNVGNVIKSWTRDQLFSDQCDDSRTVYYDIDDNGYSEQFDFVHDCSHPFEFGVYMALSTITMDNGYVINCSFPFSDTFAVLDATTSGMHDILVGDTHLFRWSGYRYEEWIWNGRDIVRQ